MTFIWGKIPETCSIHNRERENKLITKEVQERSGEIYHFKQYFWFCRVFLFSTVLAGEQKVFLATETEEEEEEEEGVSCCRSPLVHRGGGSSDSETSLWTHCNNKKRTNNNFYIISIVWRQIPSQSIFKNCWKLGFPYPAGKLQVVTGCII